MENKYTHCIKIREEDTNMEIELEFKTWEQCKKVYTSLPENISAVYYTKEFIGNATSRKDICKKCGNPVIMYWCDKCECSSEEDDFCNECGRILIVDKDYHLDCK